MKIRYLVDGSYPDRAEIILVMDNLNTHAVASLYKAFPAKEARHIARKLEIQFTPKYGSWLDIAETHYIPNLMSQSLNREFS